MADVTSVALGILSSVEAKKLDRKYARIWLCPVDENGQPKDLFGMAFQHWPDQIQDSEGTNYSSKVIPGGNRPLYQWVSGGERQISFTAVFTRDQMEAFAASEAGRHNVDIISAVNWLRSMKAPTYEDGALYPTPPPIMYLVVPNHGLGQRSEGQDYLLVIMTQCDVTWKRSFPDGTPRVVEVSLTFNEVVQNPYTGIKWYGAERYFTDGDPASFGMRALSSMSLKGR